ncbi:Zn-ribbon domain-containing OB-fold protein [Actinophytocola sp.]|uniref:Zn-ribbon domain-containing OB-fold protein n=1 Tax=Actinophytocola sp. TaxID=1872138 RepID=UPI002ED2340F
MPHVVDRALFAQLSPPRLAGARCPSCATVVFPCQSTCPRCSTGPMVAEALPEHGTVWTWTVQGYAPKPPFRMPDAEFRPYALGYVDLGDVLVESRLDVAPDRLRIGLPVRLTTIPAYRDEAGNDVHTFAFIAEMP